MYIMYILNNVNLATNLFNLLKCVIVKCTDNNTRRRGSKPTQEVQKISLK